MKKFLFLTTAVFLLLVASMALYAPVAKADAPVDFVVGVTKRSNTGVETPVLNPYVTVRTVDKWVTATNDVPKHIPLNFYPYSGNHLDSDFSGLPDTNDLALYPSISWYQWGIAAKTQLIWCGQRGKVPEGQFEVDVNIADGVNPPYLGAGHWEYQWFEKYGGLTYVASGVQQGTKARVQAVNPRQTSVWFTFVEDPPPPPVIVTPPPSVGSITIAKRGYFGNPTGAPSELKIGETLQRGQILISPNGSHKLIVQEDGNLGVYNYHGWLWQKAGAPCNNGTDSVPGDKLVFQADGNLVMPSGTSETAANIWKSGSSGLNGIVLRMQDDGNLVMYKADGTDAWHSKSPKYLNTSCTNSAEYFNIALANTKDSERYNSIANTNTTLAASNEVATAQVLVSNAYPLTGSSVFHSSRDNPSTVNGVWMYPSYTATSGDQQPYWTTVQTPAGQQVEKVQMCIDGTCYDKTWSLSCTDNVLKTGTCTFQGLRVFSGITTYVDWWLGPVPVAIPYYPWLQTKNGDVTSADYQAIKGKITGQVIGSATDRADKKGARPAASTPTESSFVIAAVSNGPSFCSDSKFALGQVSTSRDNATPQSCVNGGYTPTAVNFDKVKASIAKAYADNGNGVAKSPVIPDACNPKYATGVTVPTVFFSSSVNIGCSAGGIQKIDGSATIDFEKTNVSGRGTVWVTGDLTLNKNIKYGATTNDPKTTPNLVIFVEGDVKIDGGVTQIDASIISMKTISTCTQSGTTGVACSIPLTINGFLASGGKINFARRFYNQATPSPAELINLTSQSTTFPAPGLDRTDIDVTSKLQINGGEFAPRLN
jgi:hypothetical protein